jgi:hypothetical protein
MNPQPRKAIRSGWDTAQFYCRLSAVPLALEALREDRRDADGEQLDAFADEHRIAAAQQRHDRLDAEGGVAE